MSPKEATDEDAAKKEAHSLKKTTPEPEDQSKDALANETSQKAIVEHRNPEELEGLHDAETAKKKIELHESSDPILADEEHEKAQDSSCFVHSKNDIEQGSDFTVLRNSRYENSAQFHSQFPIPQVTYFPQPINYYPSNLQFQHIALNQVAAPYPPHVHQNISQPPLHGLSSANTGPFEPQTMNFFKGPKKKGKISKASKNSHITQSNNQRRYWTAEEDIALTNAYLYVSVDFIRNDQTSEKMWSRIFKVWKGNMRSYDETRNINSLSCHWSIIQAAVNKFHSLYESLQRAPKNGTPVKDIKREAMKMYKSMGDGSSFKFEHCWEIMIKNPKWCSQQLSKTDSSKKQKVADSSSVDASSPLVHTTPGFSVSHGNDSMDAEASPRTEIDAVAQPGGTENTKRKRKRVLEEKTMIDVLRNLQSAIEKQYTFSREELDWKREKDERFYKLQEETMKRELELKERAQKLKEAAHEIRKKAQRRKEQERILNVNLDNLQPAVQAAYEKMQARILKEWEMEGLSGDIYDNVNDKAGV